MYGNTNKLAVKNDDKDNARKKLRLASVSSDQQGSASHMATTMVDATRLQTHPPLKMIYFK